MLLVTAMVEKLGVSLVGVARKRKVAAFASTISGEQLEDRALMSAVMETAADVSTASKNSQKSQFDVTSDLGDGFEGATSNVKVKKNGNVTVSTVKFKDPDSNKVVSSLNFSKGKVDAEGQVTINVKGTISVPDSTDESENPKLIKFKFKGTGTGDASDPTSITITVEVPEGIGAGTDNEILEAGGTFDVTFDQVVAEDASVAKKSTPSVAGTFDASVTDEDDNEVTTGVVNLTQKGKKIKGSGDEDSGIGKIEGTLNVKKGEITGISKGKLEYTGENADGNPKKVNAKITKFKVDVDGTFTAVAHLADGLENVVGRDLIITGTIA
jgi:hypothetical protein